MKSIKPTSAHTGKGSTNFRYSNEVTLNGHPFQDYVPEGEYVRIVQPDEPTLRLAVQYDTEQDRVRLLASQY